VWARLGVGPDEISILRPLACIDAFLGNRVPVVLRESTEVARLGADRAVGAGCSLSIGVDEKTEGDKHDGDELSVDEVLDTGVHTLVRNPPMNQDGDQEEGEKCNACNDIA